MSKKFNFNDSLPIASTINHGAVLCFSLIGKPDDVTIPVSDLTFVVRGTLAAHTNRPCLDVGNKIVAFSNKFARYYYLQAWALV